MGSGKFNPKIALVGSGQIGGTLALLAGVKGISSDIVMLDVIEGMPQGKELDLSHALAAENVTVTVGSSNDLGETSEALRDADVVIVTAGFPRKPDMSRDDLLAKNAEVISSVGKAIGSKCPNAFVICITNPLDVMVSVLQKASGLPHARVVGMAGILDSSRFRHFLAEELHVSPRDIQTMVLGGHGDDMVPLKNYTSVSGIPLSTLIRMGNISEAKVDELVKRTRQAGGEIVKLLKMGSAYVAPAASALIMVEAYLKNERRILPCCAHITSAYGIKDCYGGVPVIIGSNGVESIVEVPLDEEETSMMKKSMESVEGLRKACRNLGFDA